MINAHQYRPAIVSKAREIVTDQEYVDRWFEAENFFRETYCTSIRKECFFITKDEWMSGDIYAVRAITPDGIETIGGPLDSFEAAEELLRSL
jgi:hypothetical protein